MLTNTLLEQKVVCFLALVICGKNFTIVSCDVYTKVYLAGFLINVFFVEVNSR